MDPIRNPYVPNAGAMPLALAGRESLLDSFTLALARVRAGRTTKSLLPYGLRGVGKTVLLRSFIRTAADSGWLTADIEADENASFVSVLAEQLRRIVFRLDASTRVYALAKRAMRILKSFTVTVGLTGLSMNLGIDAERGFGDSGDLTTDLSTLMLAIGEAAREQDTAVLIAIDEVQYLTPKDFGALIRAIHQCTQEALPILTVATGLPQVLELAGNAKSYAERLFDYRLIGPLEEADARVALVDPAAAEGATFNEEALRYICAATQGYPYFIQEWAYNAWNVAATDTIALADAVDGETIALGDLDDGFFAVRFNRCNAREKQYLRAMAELGPGPYRSADVAKVLHRPASALSPLRGVLVKKGMLWSPEYGRIAFTVPLFDAFMRRRVPEMPKAASTSERPTRRRPTSKLAEPSE